MKGGTLSAPIQITDQKIQEFNIWAGPGVSSGDTEETEGFIIDWRARVAQPPAGLIHYQVSFYAGCKSGDRSCLGEKPRLAYVVSYDYDASSKRGFVYLPRYGEPWWEVNSQHIYRGNTIEGHWFLASDSWDRFVRPVIAAAQDRSR